MLKHAKITVAGFVQGVGFRYFAQREALNLGLMGYVRNLPDGQVQSEVEGEEKIIQLYIDVLQKGPGLGYVTNIDAIWQDYSGEFKNFQIRH